MSRYNDEYYLVFKNTEINDLCLTALKKTADRGYTYERMALGGDPLFFENSYKDEDKKSGVVYPILDALMNINFVIVKDVLREKIKKFVIDGFQLYPSIILDDNGQYQEGYWFFNVYEKLDCLDFEKCTIEDYEPAELRHDIEKFYLSDDLLDAIPEERRLIFKPSGQMIGLIMVHQKIVDLFRGANHGLRFIKVSDWEDGLQFRPGSEVTSVVS